MVRRRGGSAHGYPRTARVNALLQRVLAEEIERLQDVDERLSLLTLTGVLCDPDLRHATVLFASLSEDAAAALEERRRELQARVGAQVRLKRIPMLSFAPDPAVSAGERIEAALRRGAARRPPPEGPDGARPQPPGTASSSA